MKLIKPSFLILPTTGDIYKDIERVGRICYKSEDKITDTSAIPFVNMLIGRQHTAMLEHGTVYLYFGPDSAANGYKYRDNPYSKYVEIREREQPIPVLHKCITTNYRVLVENGWLNDLQYQCEPTEYHEKRISVKFTCDRGVSHEFVRHRVFSFAQESTRYCNYSKDQFGNELTFIYPCWVSKFLEADYTNKSIPGWQEGIDIACSETNWLYAMLYAEKAYFASLENELQPQQARAVLPNSLKTELVMTGTIEQWRGFFKLRCDSAAHPQARELAIPLQEEFKRLGYVVE